MKRGEKDKKKQIKTEKATNKKQKAEKKNSYMSEKDAKKAIIDIGQRMYVKNFVAANDGNISIKTGDNEVWATPTGVSKGFMKKKMLVKVDLDGNILEGTYKPSSELKMHLRAYMFPYWRRQSLPLGMCRWRLMRSWVLKKCQKPLRPIAVPIAGYCLQTTARLPGLGMLTVHITVWNPWNIMPIF